MKEGMGQSGKRLLAYSEKVWRFIRQKKMEQVGPICSNDM